MGQQPFSEISVLDVTQGLAGPTAGCLLATYGADVVSIEPPNGVSQRRLGSGSTFPNVSRNKRSVVLDLKSERGRETLHELVSEADVLLHNHPPKRAAQFGTDYETVSAHNPEIVYCSITGYGESGEYSDRPGTDPLAQAMSGLMWSTGEPDRRPSRIGGPTIDYCTGVLAAFGIATALVHVGRTGEGQKISTSLYDTAAGIMSSRYTAYDKTGAEPHRLGDSTDKYAPCGVYETKTGPIYLAVPEQYVWERLCEAVGRTDWLEDPRFETNAARKDNREELREELEAEFATRERAALLDRLTDHFIMASEVQTVAEAATDQHLHDRGSLQRVPDVDGEEVIAAGPPLQFSKTPGRTDTVSPGVGEHTEDVLRELGFSADEIETLADAGVIGDSEATADD